MEFEEIENGFKATVPLITEEDIRVINNDFNGIVNRFSKMNIKDKDLAKAQYIIKKQQEQIEKLIRNSILKKKVEKKIMQLERKLGQSIDGRESWISSIESCIEILQELLEC